MKTRLALAGLVAASIGVVAAPPAALAANPNTGVVAAPPAALADNKNAGVVGVASKSPYEGCPDGNFCLHTTPNVSVQGRVFQLSLCKTYTLTNWNGRGSWQNQNTGNAKAWIKGRNGNILVESDPQGGPGPDRYIDLNFDFAPAWYVRAC